MSALWLCELGHVNLVSPVINWAGRDVPIGNRGYTFQLDDRKVRRGLWQGFVERHVIQRNVI